MLSLHTVREGERLSVWSPDGRVRFVDGPTRFWTFRERAEHELELELARAKGRERMVFLESIAGMQVDLTRYLVASFQAPDRLVRIEGAGTTPLLHLYPDGGPADD